jgi:signal transduction histidine kinase
MKLRRSLRYRVAMAFAAFGCLVSLLLASGMYLASHNLEERLIDDTLAAELQDYSERRARNPLSLPEMTNTIRAYVISTRDNTHIPAEVQHLAPGRHQILIDGIPFRAAVAEQRNERFAILYNESQLRRREQDLVLWLAGAVLVMTGLSAVVGYWLAGRVIAPVTDLVGRVANLRPEDKPGPLASHYPWDEIHELAQDFDDYLARLDAFIERERAFTADVSHELRTPLAVINGAAEVLLADPSLEDKTRQRLQRLARAAEEMSEITTALLVLAREGETTDARTASCDVEAVLNEVVDKWQEPLQAKSVSLVLEVQARPRLAVERAVFAMVVCNLLRNAIAFTDHGEIRLRLEQDALFISDTGVGIEPEALPRVFERYYRNEHSTGAGIGLSLVKRICDRYHWNIGIDSSPGQGTHIRLEFKPEPAS